MAQHLRVGSVVDVYTTSSGTIAHDNALVTNITNAYLEIESGDPVVAAVRPWSFISRVEVVTD